MDISALCSADSDGIKTLSTSSSPVASYRPEADAVASNKFDYRLHGIPSSPAAYPIASDNIQLQRIGYPPPPPPPPTITLNSPMNICSAPLVFMDSTSKRPDSSSIEHHYGPPLSKSPPLPLHSPHQQQKQPLVPPLSSSSSSSSSSAPISTPKTASCLESVDLSYLIRQCKTLCENLDRCRDRDHQSRSEIERQQLLDNAAKTAKKLLTSLDLLKQQQDAQAADAGVCAQRKRPIDSVSEGQDTQEAEYLAFRRAIQPFQDSTRQKIKRRTKRSTAGQRCHSCHTTETPEWRRGPDGARTLCNACGLHYSKLLRKDALTIQSDSKSLLGETAKINAISPARPSPQLIHYPIIQVQAKPIGSKTSDGVRFINSQISFPRQGESIKPYSSGRGRTENTGELGTARIFEFDDDGQ